MILIVVQSTLKRDSYSANVFGFDSSIGNRIYNCNADVALLPVASRVLSLLVVIKNTLKRNSLYKLKHRIVIVVLPAIATLVLLVLLLVLVLQVACISCKTGHLDVPTRIEVMARKNLRIVCGVVVCWSFDVIFGNAAFHFL